MTNSNRVLGPIERAYEAGYTAITDGLLNPQPEDFGVSNLFRADFFDGCTAGRVVREEWETACQEHWDRA